MKASRITALGLVAAATLWILSGHLLPRETAESSAAIRTNETEGKKLFRVGVTQTSLVPHSRKLVLSGHTEADRRVTLTARTGGVLTEVRVRRGSVVKEGDIVAILSDEARISQVAQAKSLVIQRQTELEAKKRLIATGANPKLDQVNLEAQLDAAKAAQAAAEAELDRGVVRAPWAGVVSDITVEVGKAAFSFAGADLCTIVALDPMLAVVEVSERKLAGIKVGDMAEVRLITGDTARGKVRFVSKTASQTTRTYRIEIELPNADGAIPDGISADVAIPLAPIAATSVPRSALTFSSTGTIGVRAVDDDGVVGFLPVNIIEDEQSIMWVGGVPDGRRVIVQGQDFVREGQHVEAVPATEYSASR
ncbi:MAG TPA: efflux RND transporter periplasmic adaptor subunit [Xanthobacteraceae bacterium]|jgi:multidrug efflux system membrane fusion protein